MEERGSSNLIFEVQKQVNNGPLISTKYFRLSNGQRQEIEGSFSNKVHSFKNFKCNSHNLFYGINLYRETPGRNPHQMRLNPFGHRNDSLLREFLAL